MIELLAAGDLTPHESRRMDGAETSQRPVTSSSRSALSGLLGRRRECAAADQLLTQARSRRAATLVVTGAAGCGKSAMLAYVRAAAGDFQVVDSCGVESETELPYAGVHQLCVSMRGPMDRLPEPQRRALHAALGLAATPAAQDRFLVGLAVLSLFALKADEQPLLCLVDDAQWLDQPTLQALAFVSRRLIAEPIAMVFGLREDAAVRELAGLPTVALGGLGNADANRLLASSVPTLLDEHVRDRIVAEAHGNPLALQELPRGLSPDQLAGGFAIPDAGSVTTRVEHSFIRRARALPRDTRLLLLVAAAEPVGDPGLLWRAVQQLGVSPEAAVAAERAGLIDFGPRVCFRHPLVRSAIYHAADLTDRRMAHRALAQATDPSADPDRRAWHLAQAAIGPDEDVAEDLGRSAARACARAGLAAGAAFYERAAHLTLDPERRRSRYLTAAQAKLQAGAPESAGDLLLSATSGPLSDLERARADLLCARIGFAVERGREAPHLFLKAARQLERLDVLLARDTYLDALSAAMFAGRLASGVTVFDVAQAALSCPPAPQPPRPADLLLDALAIRFTDGYAAAKVPLQRAVRVFTGGRLAPEDEMHWLWLACTCAAELWDDASWCTLTAQYVTRVRETGALSELPLALSQRGAALVFTGHLAEVGALVDETQAASEVTGSHLVPYGAALLAGWRGDEVGLDRLAEASMREARHRGEGIGVGVIQSALAVMHNSVGRYSDALIAAAVACAHPNDLVSSYWGLAELIEAAVRVGDGDRARTALQTLSATTVASGTGWALGVEARCRALLTTGVGAEDHYQEAIDRLTSTQIRNDLARAHLLYGEWLQRAKRRADARDHLHAAHDLFAAMGAEAWSERAARGLRTAGENVPRRSSDTPVELTTQEHQIAQLARDGLSNLEIGARLFLSPRTVEWHLGNVFAKLGITSRRALGRTMSG